MKVAFTICSNNYLAYAATLRKSMKQYMPQLPFYIFLCDEKHVSVKYETIADEVIELRSIEPEFNLLVSKYNIVESNTCIKPRVFEYLFTERDIDEAIFFDPDIKIFAPFHFLFDELQQNNILLTPHICSPIPFDGKTPLENSFLNFGIYNLGFLAAKNSDETKSFLDWWKMHTYFRGNIDVYNGVFVDQLPINLAPVFFKGVKILCNKGLNMAPWNLHERKLLKEKENYVVDKSEPLIFYHFSSFKTNNIELPLSQYDRYRLDERSLLKEIYLEYRDDLINNGNEIYSKINFAYAELRKKHVRLQKQKKWRNKLLLKKYWAKKS